MGRIILRWQLADDLLSPEEEDAMSDVEHRKWVDTLWADSMRAKERFEAVERRIAEAIVEMTKKYRAVAFLTHGGLMSGYLCNPFVVRIDIQFADEHRNAIHRDLAKIISFLHA